MQMNKWRQWLQPMAWEEASLAWERPCCNFHLQNGRRMRPRRGWLAPLSYVCDAPSSLLCWRAGHVDNMCCFIRPGVVALAWSDNEDDPQVSLA